MKPASLVELGKNVVCGMFRMAGHVLRVLWRGPDHTVLALPGTIGSCRSTAFWIKHQRS